MNGLNGFLDDGKLEERILDALFEALWQKFSDDVSGILSKSVDIGTNKTISEKIDSSKILGAFDELMSTTRALSQTVGNPERLLPPAYLEHAFRRARLAVGRPQEAEEISFLLRKIRATAQDLASREEDLVKNAQLQSLYRLIIQLDRSLDMRPMRSARVRMWKAATELDGEKLTMQEKEDKIG